jgi:PAS domain-containing protein
MLGSAELLNAVCACFLGLARPPDATFCEIQPKFQPVPDSAVLCDLLIEVCASAVDKQTDEQETQMHATLTELLENLSAGMLWLSGEGQVRYANARAAARTRLTAD